MHHSFKDTKKLQFKKFHGIYWTTLGFLDTEKANFINCGEKKISTFIK